jgi:hypothetical protein
MGSRLCVSCCLRRQGVGLTAKPSEIGTIARNGSRYLININYIGVVDYNPRECRCQNERSWDQTHQLDHGCAELRRERINRSMRTIVQ